MFCRNCNLSGDFVYAYRGSGIIAAVLIGITVISFIAYPLGGIVWLVILVIYFGYVISTRYKTCEHCGSRDLLPDESPLAK